MAAIAIFLLFEQRKIIAPICHGHFLANAGAV
jgi:hypothetical protein